MSIATEREPPPQEERPAAQPASDERAVVHGRPTDSAYTDFGAPSRRRWALPLAVRYLLALAAGLLIGGWLVHRYDRAPVVIVSVNGQVINKESFFHRLQVADGPALIRQMVAEDLRLQFAQKQGVAPTEAQIDTRYDEAASRPGFQDYLTSHGLSVRDCRRSLALDLAQVNVLTKGISVSDDDVRSYYRRNIDKHNLQAQFYMPETTQVEVVVTRTRQQAEQAAQELERYEPFDVVAREYSVDSAARAGGVLPLLQRGRTKFKNLPGLEDAIFDLKIGDQVGPRKFGGQWWIIRCLNKAPETTLPFSQVRADCIMGAKMQKALPLRGKEVEQEFAQFQRDSTVRAFWPQYQGAVSTH